MRIVYTQTLNILKTLSLICVEKSELAGHVGVIIREAACDSNLLVVAGIPNLAVSPGFRGEGAGKELVLRAQDEAAGRGVPRGLLFCTHDLESYYVSIGCSRSEYRVTMDGLNGCLTPLPAGLITMVKVFGTASFPPGDIYLKVQEWQRIKLIVYAMRRPVFLSRLSLKIPYQGLIP